MFAAVTLIWAVARASGLVAWGLLAASVVWGLALSTRVLGHRARPAWLLDLHRFLGGLAVVFTLVHVAAIAFDSYVAIGLTGVLVPLATTWRPMAVAAGVVGLYFLAAVEITSLLRKRLPNRWWRRVHYTSFPLFVLVTVHGLAAGTDTHSGRVLLGVVVVTMLVAVLLRIRLERVYAKRNAAGPVIPDRLTAWKAPLDPLLVNDPEIDIVDVRPELQRTHR